MFPMTISLNSVLLPLAGAVVTGAAAYLLRRRERHRLTRETQQRLDAERAAGLHLTFSTIEALTYAIEATDRYNIGHLDCVQRCVAALSRTLNLPEAEAAPLRAAALLHNIGRLGVPEHILLKAGALTAEEQEKLRAHPVLGARILASIPFPWQVVPIVRHHAEHWDGSGYPDGLKGSAIPFAARILAIANAYSALLHDRPFRNAMTPQQALAEIEARSGTQFDPAVVTAFRAIANELRAEAETRVSGVGYRVSAEAGEREKAKGESLILDTNNQKPETKNQYPTPDAEARAALDDIAEAQRETMSLLRLTQAVNESLHLEAVCDTLLASIREIVPCAACALFLPEKEGEFLHAHGALGVNERHLLGSTARVGTYLTGRAFTRGEIVRASFLPDDLLLRDVSDTWTPFRSTLIVPLQVNGMSLGTLNLYSEEPEAFGFEAQRVLRLVATQGGRALDNACRFAAVQETAYTDAMTGLKNARFLREYLEREVNRAQREESPLAVLNIDLDNFKPVNDRFGHARGDQTLREVAEILTVHIRNYDLAARYAGDEFVVVLARADRIAAEVVAMKLKMAVEQHAQRILSREPDFPKLSISVGIALYPEDGLDLQSLLCRSDAAMYRDKRSHRSVAA
jgi:diguanylate cyclase (GGDEF)-like protein